MRALSHILEDESKVSFRNILPKEWVIRDKPQDYGIDLEVELFSNQGLPLGLIFWVQLKATSSQSIKEQKSVKIERDKLNQLNSYKVPTALFRYCSENRIFYFDWIINPYLKNSCNSTKYVSITFDDKMLFNEQSANMIELYLKRLNHQSKSPFLPPFLCFIDNRLEKDPTNRYCTLRLLSQIKFVELTLEKNYATLEFKIYHDRISLQPLGREGIVMPFSSVEDKKNEILITVKLCIVLFLAQIGSDKILIDFIEENELLETIIRRRKILYKILNSLIDAADNTSILLEKFHQIGGKENFVLIQTMISALLSETIKSSKLEEYHLGIINIYEKGEDTELLSTAYFNLASFYLKSKKYLEAISYYNKARKAQPDFLNKAYFNRDLALCLYKYGSYFKSTIAFQRAFDLEPNCCKTAAILGESYMRAGNFNEAKRYFKKFYELENGYESMRHFVSLARIITDVITKRTFFTNQIQRGNKYDHSSNQLHELKKKALITPFDNELWNEIANISANSQEYYLCMIANIFLAVIDIKNPTVWANCTFLATLDSTATRILPDIINSAYQINKIEYLIALSEWQPSDSLKSINKDKVIENVESLIIEPLKPGKTIYMSTGETIEL